MHILKYLHNRDIERNLRFDILFQIAREVVFFCCRLATILTYILDQNFKTKFNLIVRLLSSSYFSSQRRNIPSQSCEFKVCKTTFAKKTVQ